MSEQGEDPLAQYAGGDFDYRQFLRDWEDRNGKQEEEDQGFGRGIATFWRRLKESSRFGLGENIGTRTVESVARGAAKGVNNISDFAVGVAVNTSRKTGLYKLERDEEEEREFLDFWADGIQESNRLHLYEGEEDPERGWGYRLLEGGVQLATGFVAGGGAGRTIGGGLASAAGGGARATAVAGSLGAGAAADFLAFDPQEERLANIIQSGPEWLQNPVTDYLAADADDGDLEGRVKSALEGMLTGGPIDLALLALRKAKATRLLKEGKIREDQISGFVEGATKAADEDAVEVVHVPGDDSVLRLKDPAWAEEFRQLFSGGDEGEGIGRLAGEEGSTEIRFSDPQRAESVGAAMNDALRAEARPRTLTDDNVRAFRTVLDRIQEGSDPRDAARLFSGIRVNFNRTLAPKEALQIINGLTQSALPEDDIARMMAGALAKDGQRATWEATAKLADGLVEGLSGAQFVARLNTMGVSAEQQPAFITAARTVMYGMGQEVDRLNRLLDVDPDNPILWDEFATALDSLHVVEGHVAGLTSNAGRTMNVLRMKVGGRLPGGLAGGAADATRRTVDSAAPEGAETAAGVVKGSERTRQLSKGQPRVAEALQGNAEFFGKVPGEEPRLSSLLTKRELQAMARTIRYAEGDPTKILGAMRSSMVLGASHDVPKGLARRMGENALAFRANMMLSGPQTHEANFFSNVLASVMVPSEHFFAGVIRGDLKHARQGLDMLGGPVMEGMSILRESMNAARKAFLDGDGILDPGHMTLEDVAETGLRGEDNVVSRWIGNVIGAPTRLLTTSDEFFKQMNYRSAVRAQSLRSAREAAEVRGLTGKERRTFLAERLADDLEFSFDVRGGAVNPYALDHARYTTFTTDLEPGGFIGKWLQDGATKHPILRLVFPFVRTPVNIFRYNWQRMPVLGMIQKEMREDLLSGDSERVAKALSRQASGTMMYSAAASLAYSKMITGGGPKEPRLREQWITAGNQPYSVRFGDKWVSYRRLEPFGTVLSTVADFVEMTGELSEEDAENFVATAAASLSSSVASKSFMLGMVQTFDAIASGDEALWERLFTNTATSFLPAAARQLNPDDVWRESRGLLEEFQARTPGWSEELEPRRNLFGEIVAKPPSYFNRAFNPFTAINVSDDFVAEELLMMGQAVPMPPEKVGTGKERLDLTDRVRWDNGSGQSPYDRMLQLLSEPTQGPSLREQLTDVILSPSWTEASGGNDLYPGGVRLQIVRDVVLANHEFAMAQVLEEYPALQSAWVQDKVSRAESLVGSSAGLLEAASR